MDISNHLGSSVHNAALLIRKHSPLILTTASIVTGTAATVSAIKVTPEANDILKRIQAEDIPQSEKAKKILTEVAPLYTGTIVLQGVSIASSVGSYSIQKNRLNIATQALAGLSSLYLLKQEELKKTKEAIAEKFGEHVEEEIERSVAEKEAKEKEDETKDIVIANDGPEEIMQDSISGQYFKNTREQIYWLCNELGHRLEFEDLLPASDYFIDAGIDACNLGDDVGWLSGDRPWPKFVDFILPDGRKAVKVIIDTNPAFGGYKNYY
jgi:hypothetical protein